MARSHGRILASIWTDDDWRALDGEAQRVYMLLISQPNLTHAGTLPLTIKRWARLSGDTNEQAMLATLRRLATARFVVVDGETEELLVRTLLRNDGVYRQPKVLRAALNDARAITSKKLRRALRAEVVLCPLSEVAERARDEVQGLLDELADALTTPPDDPNGGVSDTQVEGSPIPKGNPPRNARGGAPALSPAPTPTPSPAVSDGAATALMLVTDASPSTGKLLGLFVEHCKKRPPSQTVSRMGRAVKELLADGVDPDDIAAGLVIAAQDGLGPTQLPTAVHQQMNRRPRGSSNMQDHAAFIQQLPSDDYLPGEIA